MMDIRVYKIKAGEEKTFCREGEEVAVLLLAGKITYIFDGQEKPYPEKMYLLKDLGVFMFAVVQKLLSKQIAMLKFLFNVQKTKNNSLLNYMLQKMHLGAILLLANLVMLQNAV